MADNNRPKKRIRSQSPHENLTVRSSSSEVSKELQHDPEYYFEDGSTVILVDNVLFKVHRTILSRDSSAFETMFNLPAGDSVQVEGGRDSNPIVLQGDSPQQFRSLLWALYAMPHEILQAGSNIQADWPEFDRFCDLVFIAHKYCFKNLESWALGAFLNWLVPSSRHLPPRIHSSTALTLICACAETPVLDRLRRVLELAVLCDDHRIHNAVVQRLEEELRSPLANLPWFIALGERFGISTVIGAAYYALMVQGRSRWIHLATGGFITPVQLARLHHGYYGLVTQWEAYRVAPPTIMQCQHHGHCCKERWHAYWKELTKDDVIMCKFPADVLGRLDTALSRVYAYNSIMDMHQECRSRALSAVRLLIKETKEGLGSHFVDLP